MDKFELHTTWTDLLKLFALIVLLYGTIRILSFMINRFGKKNLTQKKIKNVLTGIEVVYPLVSALLLVFGFISINTIPHGVLVLALVLLGLTFIRNYIGGVFVKLNPLISEGALIRGNNFEGEINRLLATGMVVNTKTGERFVSYHNLEKDDFTINSNMSIDVRQTVYLKTELSKDAILDLLFVNPILDFNEKPSLKFQEENNLYNLNLTLEQGATLQHLVAYLKEHNIEAFLTEKPI